MYAIFWVLPPFYLVLWQRFLMGNWSLYLKATRLHLQKQQFHWVAGLTLPWLKMTAGISKSANFTYLHNWTQLPVTHQWLLLLLLLLYCNIKVIWSISAFHIFSELLSSSGLSSLHNINPRNTTVWHILCFKETQVRKKSEHAYLLVCVLAVSHHLSGA